MNASKKQTSLIEKLETRQMMSASPVDLAGEYVASQNGVLYQVDLRHIMATKTSYNGDLVSGSVDLKIAGNESTQGILTGTVKDISGKSHNLTASFSGKTLKAVVDGQATYLTKVSNTPAAAPPALVARTGHLFNYESPIGWGVNEGTSGIVISSPDGTQQVGLVGGVSNGVIGTNNVISAETGAGDHFLTRKALKNGWVGNGLYAQQEADLFTFTHNGQQFASAEIVTTLINYYGGTYNYSTGAYSGQTLTIIEIVTAPKAQFIADSANLGNMLANINARSSTSAPTAHTHDYGYGGFYDPGVYGNWSYSGGFDYSSNPWLYSEQTYMASSSSSFDASCASFDAYLLS